MRNKRPELVGTRIGRLVVLGRSEQKYKKESMYLCRCDCGTEKPIRATTLYDPQTRSCGCLHRERMSGDRFVGQVFHSLTVIERTEQRTPRRGARLYLYRCRCACGKETLTTANDLTAGKTKSCGCKRWVRLPAGEAGFRATLAMYRSGAERRGLPFALTEDQFRVITSSDCFYCGAPPERQKIHATAKTNHSLYLYNGIDRSDNAHGYTPENSLPCCTRCNMAKGKLSRAEFLELIRTISTRHPP